MKPIVIVVCQKCEKRKRKGYGEVEADLLDEGLAIFRSELLGYFRGDLSSLLLFCFEPVLLGTVQRSSDISGLGVIDMFEKRVESSSIALAVE